VDVEKIRKYIKKNPQDFPFLKGNVSQIDNAPRLSIGGFVGIVKAVKEKKLFTIARDSILLFESANQDEVIINTSRIQDHDGTNPFSLSDAEIIGRQQVEELDRIFKKYVPGFENSILVHSGPNIGVRSSRQIQGMYTLTKSDLMKFTKFEDAIACSAYPIDIHPPQGSQIENHSDYFKSGDYYTIPYRCLVNQKIRNLVTAGRCISADFDAQAAIRTTPTAGAIGHAAGLAASLAVKNSIAAADIPYKVLREILVKQDAFLG